MDTFIIFLLTTSGEGDSKPNSIGEEGNVQNHKTIDYVDTYNIC